VGPAGRCVVGKLHTLVPKLGRVGYLSRCLQRIELPKNLTPTALYILFTSSTFSLNSEMDAFSTFINAFSTDSTFEREDVPVDLETSGGSGSNQCIIA
jgi:hypothetical protein